MATAEALSSAWLCVSTEPETLSVDDASGAGLPHARAVRARAITVLKPIVFMMRTSRGCRPFCRLDAITLRIPGSHDQAENKRSARHVGRATFVAPDHGDRGDHSSAGMNGRAPEAAGGAA